VPRHSRESGNPVTTAFAIYRRSGILDCPVKPGNDNRGGLSDLGAAEFGLRIRPGERGALVLSNLTNRATVVLNYLLGDMATLATGACPCGRTLPLIESIDGRLTDLIARPGGSVVHSMSIVSPLLGVPGVRQVQIIQEDMLEFRVRVVWAQGEPGNGEDLRAVMLRVLGAGIRVQVEPVDRIEMEQSGKVKTVISKVRAQVGAR